MTQIDLESAQTDFASWYEGIFREAIDYVVHSQNDDLFDEYLSAWAVALGVLAYNNLSAIIVLLKERKLRSAYMLSRSLIDYHVRLRYYILQSAAPKQQWLASNSRSIYNFLNQCKAYVDWKNAHDKTFSILKGRPMDLEGMPTSDRDRFIAELEREHDVYSRDLQHMLDIAEPDDEMRRFLRSTWLFQSGYLHGDQITLAEVLEKAGEDVKVNWDSKGVSAVHTLGEAVYYCQELLASVKLIKGWVYGHQVAWERGAVAFRDPLQRAMTI